MRKPLFLIPFLLLNLQVLLAQNTTAPKPTFIVSLERQAIRENDCVPFQIWFSDDDNVEVSEVTVHLVAPSFLKFDQNKCGSPNQKFVNTVTLPVVQAPTVYQATLYLKTEPNITVGDYTLLFTSQYLWKSGKQQRHSVLSVEKPIKVNFLGSESVAGVPLGLAGLIVPGLCFWLVVRLFGISWGVETGLGDKLIYSVVISFIFVGLASVFIKYAPWLRNLDVSSGISITKLIWLAGTGTVVGLVVSAFETVRRQRRQRKAAAAQINVDDDDVTRFGKLLKLNPTYNPSRWRRFFRKFSGGQTGAYLPQTTVMLEDCQYIGSLGVKQGDMTTLAGWFKVTKGNAAAELVAELEELARKGDILTLFERATQENLTIKGRDGIKRKDKGRSALNDETFHTKQWPNSAVLQLAPRPNNPAPKSPLIVE